VEAAAATLELALREEIIIVLDFFELLGSVSFSDSRLNVDGGYVCVCGSSNWDLFGSCLYISSFLLSIF